VTGESAAAEPGGEGQALVERLLGGIERVGRLDDSHHLIVAILATRIVEPRLGAYGPAGAGTGEQIQVILAIA